jgi:hypothetical protein
MKPLDVNAKGKGFDLEDSRHIVLKISSVKEEP